MAQNSRMIAAMKSGTDRDKWIEDADAQAAGAKAITDLVNLKLLIQSTLREAKGNDCVLTTTQFIKLKTAIGIKE